MCLFLSTEILVCCSHNQANFYVFWVTLLYRHPQCMLVWLQFWRSDKLGEELSWPLLSSSTVQQLLSEDNASWQLTLFLSPLIWNASSWISFKFNILKQHTRAILSTTIIRMYVCVFGRVFVTVSQNLLCADSISQPISVFFFFFWGGCFPHKADYVLSVLQTGDAAIRKTSPQSSKSLKLENFSCTDKFCNITSQVIKFVFRGQSRLLSTTHKI